ncbi:imidazole glycerol phosphate synthase subunit HisF [Luteimonas sp. e5]
MLTRRIIPCLDVRDGRVVKGVRFADHVDMGAIADLAVRYRDAGADELVMYDITASVERRHADLAWVRRLAELLDIPFCVAGGIDSVDAARRMLQAGASKVSVNTPALLQPALVDALADAFGSARVVVGIDSLRDADGIWRVRSHTGDPAAMRTHPRPTLEWIAEVQQRGAGEVVLNCMNSDGVRDGYDIAQLQAARAVCQVPLVASGGAGKAEHFIEVFTQANVDGALAASAFHSGTVQIGPLKQALRKAGVEVRDGG